MPLVTLSWRLCSVPNWRSVLKRFLRDYVVVCTGDHQFHRRIRLRRHLLKCHSTEQGCGGLGFRCYTAGTSMRMCDCDRVFTVPWTSTVSGAAGQNPPLRKRPEVGALAPTDIASDMD